MKRQKENSSNTDKVKEKPIKYGRKIKPEDISVPEGYSVEVFAEGLTTPINMIFTNDGQIYLADAGITDNNGKVLKYINNRFQVIADGFNPPLTGINYLNGTIYVSHRGKITIIKPDGSKQDIISGLPSFGDHHNNQVIFDTNGKMYFGQGTATNSGVVGEDNAWVLRYPFFHDYPGSNIMLKGTNFITENFLTSSPNDTVYTGAYSPFGTPSQPWEIVKGTVTASGSILRANIDGSNLELLAWGLRNPFRLKFDNRGRLFAANHGMDVRGSRPVDNSPDEFQHIYPGAWYGWPDYTGGLPVTRPTFKAEDMPQPEFLLAQHPMLPPKPHAVFTPHSAIMGFDFNYTGSFPHFGDAYIAEFGSEAPETTGGKPLPGVGHRISRIDMSTGRIYTFAINKSGYPAYYTGGGGLERPIDVIFSKSGDMYVLDFGVAEEDEEDAYRKGSGVIWRIVKNK